MLHPLKSVSVGHSSRTCGPGRCFSGREGDEDHLLPLLGEVSETFGVEPVVAPALGGQARGHDPAAAYVKGIVFPANRFIS